MTKTNVHVNCDEKAVSFFYKKDNKRPKMGLNCSPIIHWCHVQKKMYWKIGSKRWPIVC